MTPTPKILQCGEYAPDQADFGNVGTSTAQNVIPRTKASYGPVPSFVTVATTALNGPPLGAFSACDSAGNGGNYVGTTSKLYAQTSATKPNFADRSGAAYSTPAGSLWGFAEANGYVYATNGTDPIQKVATATTNNFANHPDTNAPKAKHIAYIQPGFLLLGDINDPTVGIQPQGIRWSVLGNADSFPLVGGATAIAGNSDWQPILGSHGRMMGFAPNLSSCAAAIFFEQAIFKMVFTGTDKIFAIQPVEQARGTPSPRAITQVGQVCYFLAQNGFFAFDGTEAIPIGEGKINKAFFADADPNYLGQVRAAADPVSGLCFWSYAGAGNAAGVPNRILVYNPYINRFSFITAPGGNHLFLSRTLGTTLDGIDALGYNLDTLPYSLDSSYLTGGNLALAGFDASFKHGYYSGPNMAFVLDTVEAQLSSGRCSKISSVRPLAEGGAVSAAVGSRATTAVVPVFGAAVLQDSRGRCPARNEALYQRIRLSGAAGHTCQHILGAEVEYGPGAKR